MNVRRFGRAFFRLGAMSLVIVTAVIFSSQWAESQRVVPKISDIPVKTPEKPKPGTRARNILRKTLPADAKVIGLEFQVIKVDAKGKEELVDPMDHTFEVGESIKVRVIPQDDLFIYIFTEGPPTQKPDEVRYRACLHPKDGKTSDFSKKDEAIVLPDDGDLFTFAPPSGEEKLVVVACKEPDRDLALLKETALSTKGAVLKSADLQNAKTLDATIENERKRSLGRSRGPMGKLKVREGGDAPQQMQLIPDVENKEGEEVVAMNSNRIFVEIPLKSTHANQKKG